MEDHVILVDENDKQIGTMEKMQAHREGKLHRAFSILIFNSKGELLLQQRAHDKYHCPKLWTNTCCSHPREHETILQAAHRRLSEEMGFDCPLEERLSFIYRVAFDNGLTEHEVDHVLVGTYDGPIRINPNEAAAYKWISRSELASDIKRQPHAYTPWFRIICNEHLDKIK